MAGKDLIDSRDPKFENLPSARASRRRRGSTMSCFWTRRARKISKSKGNGLSIEEWLAYAPAESLQLFMFQKPKTAKRLFFDVIPKTVDEYQPIPHRLSGRRAEAENRKPGLAHPWAQSRRRPTWMSASPCCLNLASAAAAEDKETLWAFIRKYAPEATPENRPGLDIAAACAVALLSGAGQAAQNLSRARRQRARRA